MMKKSILLIIIAMVFTQVYSQEWEIEGHEIKVKKTGSKLTLSWDHSDHVLLISADTIYPFNTGFDFAFLLFEQNGKLGVVDPFDLYVIAEAQYESFKLVDAQLPYIFAKENVEYSVLMDNFQPLFKEKFKKIQHLDTPGYSEFLFLVENNDKKGVIDLEGDGIFILKMVYDDIILLPETSLEDIRFHVRKGAKEGICGYGNVILKPKYNEVKQIVGDGPEAYLVKKRNKKGMIIEGYKDHPIIFDKISFVGNAWPSGYIIFEKKGKFDVLEGDSQLNFKPRFDKVWTETKDGKEILYMSKDGEISTINL
ncbi:MAG: hypothetical protein ABFS35_03980 [Bacteroidota bacterium]